MRSSSLGLGLVLIGAFVGCGGSTEGSGLGGASGSGATGTGATGSGATSGSGGGGNVGGSTGGSGNVGGSTGGTGNVGGGIGGSGNVGGNTGGGGGCVELGCGPNGTTCCSPGSGCGTASGGGPSLSCTCTDALVWKCTTGTGGAGGGGGVGGGNGCIGPNDCAPGTTCCNSQCVNTANDPYNCGGCNNVCAASPPYCSGGICGKAPCFGTPPSNGFCCGLHVCTPGMLCCDIQAGGPSSGPTCFAPTATQKTCPIGCPLCQ